MRSVGVSLATRPMNLTAGPLEVIRVLPADQDQEPQRVGEVDAVEIDRGGMSAG